jgi:hypothetical protein
MLSMWGDKRYMQNFYAEGDKVSYNYVVKVINISSYTLHHVML